MIKKYITKQSGITLIEVLASLVILTMVTGVTFGVLTTSVKFNDKTQSHVNLRQEANIIVTTLRQHHQQKKYSDCFEDYIANDKIEFKEFKVKQNTIEVNCNYSVNIDPLTDLEVNFVLVDAFNNEFEIDTIIEAVNHIPDPLTINIQPNSQDPETCIDDPDCGGGDNDFYDFLLDKNVFVYGSQLLFKGNQINGPNATMVILGSLNSSDLNGGALGNISNIYINGNANFDSGSAGLGSSINPGLLYVNGNLSLWSGTRSIYGDVHVSGDLRLKDAKIYGNIYVDGDVELGWTPWLSDESKVYYTGSFTHPASMSTNITSKFIKESIVPTFDMPIYDLPPVKSDQWYEDNGYVSGGDLANGRKIFTHNNYSFSSSQTFNNVIIVSKGDITLSNWMHVTGILYAPNGKVTFGGGSFEGLVIAKDGFFVTSGGSTVTFKGIDQFIDSLEDYPF
ncbi:prepilin-type N-terminal cleavage/methylation domain-containing protein [Bacillaceae bacterium IKA-2]|nr:prepilin-type N-terminal cleavage/methylation domain-containing protein [Bacillaceae bacterium IKA-2]